MCLSETQKPLVLVTCATGKTGNIGGFVALALASSGSFRIRIAARNLDKARDRFEKAIPDASYVRLDLSDPSTFASAIEGADRIFLGHPESGFEAKELQQAFFDTVAAVKPSPPFVVKFVAAFSSDFLAKMAKHTPLLHYGIQNNADIINDFKAKHGSKHVAVVEARSWFMQNYVAEFKEMVAAGCLMSGSEDACLPRIDSRDIADAALACLQDPAKHGGQVYNLTGGELYQESEIAAKLSKATGRAVAYSPDPTPLKPIFEPIKIDGGLTMWDIMSDLWNLEKMTRDLNEPLQPKVFEELTGQKYRSFDAFIAENLDHWSVAEKGKSVSA